MNLLFNRFGHFFQSSPLDKASPRNQSGTFSPAAPPVAPPRDRIDTIGQPKGNVPQVSFFGAPAQQLQSQGQQLEYVLQHADSTLLNRYGLAVTKSATGQLASFNINGRPASLEEAKQHIAAHSGKIQLELSEAQNQVNSQYTRFVTLANKLYNQLSQSEQTSVRILLQTLNVLYSGFGARVTQISALASSKGMWV